MKDGQRGQKSRGGERRREEQRREEKRGEERRGVLTGCIVPKKREQEVKLSCGLQVETKPDERSGSGSGLRAPQCLFKHTVT